MASENSPTLSTLTVATKIGKGDIWELECSECKRSVARVTTEELAGIAAQMEPVYCFECEGSYSDNAPAQLWIEDGYIKLRGNDGDTYVKFECGYPADCGIEITQEKLAQAKLNFKIWLHENAE